MLMQARLFSYIHLNKISNLLVIRDEIFTANLETSAPSASKNYKTLLVLLMFQKIDAIIQFYVSKTVGLNAGIDLKC
jgi:hypothetical protein